MGVATWTLRLFGHIQVLTLPYVYCSKVVRKSVARVLTVISQEQKKALRDVYKNKVRTHGDAIA